MTLPWIRMTAACLGLHACHPEPYMRHFWCTLLAMPGAHSQGRTSHTQYGKLMLLVIILMQHVNSAGCTADHHSLVPDPQLSPVMFYSAHHCPQQSLLARLVLVVNNTLTGKLEGCLGLRCMCTGFHITCVTDFISNQPACHKQMQF